VLKFQRKDFLVETFSDLFPTSSDILIRGLNERFFDGNSADKEMNVRTSVPLKLIVVYILDGFFA
jgi:hypothetical protein